MPSEFARNTLTKHFNKYPQHLGNAKYEGFFKYMQSAWVHIRLNIQSDKTVCMHRMTYSVHLQIPYSDCIDAWIQIQYEKYSSK